MKQFFFAAIMGLSAYAYLHRSPAVTKTTAIEEKPNLSRPIATNILIVPTPTYSSRWKTGLTAQTDLKTGPNAQTTFEPFAPSEHATWNQNPGYTIMTDRPLRYR